MKLMQVRDDEPTFGPWMGVPESHQKMCAVIGCSAEGKSHRCLYDGGLHHHGCIHYDCAAADVTNHGLKFRDGWGWLCDKHYNVLKLAAVLREKPAVR